MIRRSLALTALLLSACGPAPLAGDGVDLRLVVSRGLLDELSAFQIAVVTRGASLDCVAVQQRCLKDQVDASRLVPLRDASGATRSALRLPLSLTPGSPNTQATTLRDLPVGRDFALVIEAITRDVTPRLAGSSCTYVKTLNAGVNPAVVAKIERLATPADCDPSL